MIPAPLVPLFTALRLEGALPCIAGGYAACPELASDIDVWICNGERIDHEAVKRLVGVSYPTAEWKTVIRHPVYRTLAMARTGKIVDGALTRPVEFMITHYETPAALLEDFDLSVHAIAMDLKGKIVSPRYTHVHQPIEVHEQLIEDGGYDGGHRIKEETTVGRLRRLKRRYWHFRHPLLSRILGWFR